MVREIWRRLGKPSLLAYMKDVLGYAPKTARDRMRVAVALDEMPALAEALENGDQSYSALRELTRVVTPNTQREWCDAVRGKNLRQIEELVGVHRRGDLPTDPPNPDLAPRVVRFEVTTATYALLRQAQRDPRRRARLAPRRQRARCAQTHPMFHACPPCTKCPEPCAPSPLK